MGGQKNIHRVWLAILLTVAPIAAPSATPGVALRAMPGVALRAMPGVALRAMPVREMTLRLPFERYHGLIFLKARVNGSEPLSFIFDTGATITVINEPRATALGLTPRDRRLIAGADGGEGTMSFAFARDVAIDLGDARFAPDQVGVTS